MQTQKWAGGWHSKHLKHQSPIAKNKIEPTWLAQRTRALSTMAKTAGTKSGRHDESQKLHLPPEAALGANLQQLQVRRHRRSISQLMASMGNV